MDIRIKRLAQVLLEYSLSIKPEEKILIQGDFASLPLVQEVYKQSLQLGAFPSLRMEDESLRYLLLKYGNDHQISYIPEENFTMVRNVDAIVYLLGGFNTRNLTNIEPGKIKLQTKAKEQILKIYLKRVQDQELKWCATQFPTHASAQDANMALEDFEEFVYGAAMVNYDDPIQQWQKLTQNQQLICDYLSTRQSFRIVSTDTDISFSTKGREWINCCGKINFPDGEVYCSPIEDSVEGYIRFSFPGIYESKAVDDIQLKFEKGEVVTASASAGEDLLKEILDTDEGARRVGEVAIGTNPYIKDFTRNIFFDEKISGTLHMALGFSIPGSHGLNKSAIHWDMLCDMRENGKIYADDELIYKNGSFITL